MVAKKTKETPLMTQYNEIKASHPGALLLFRVGDFYETFGEDAVTTSKILGIVLTKRANGSASEIELAGFPFHSLETYLPRLVQAGQRVAICEQLEDPKATKSIVKRGVTELVTPGAHFRDGILKDGKNNFLASWYLAGSKEGLAFIDISTGEFLVVEDGVPDLDRLLTSLEPKEVVIPLSLKSDFEERYGNAFYLSTLPDWACKPAQSITTITSHFQTYGVKGFGLDSNSTGVVAAGMALQYLVQNGHQRMAHISTIQLLTDDSYMWLDRFTLRNLEVLQSNSADGVSLIDVVDKSVTPMGKRVVRRWLSAPLRRKDEIDERLDTVQFFVEDDFLCAKLRSVLERIPDLERSVSRLAAQRIGPRELFYLARSLKLFHEHLQKELSHSFLNGWRDVQIGLKSVLLTLSDDPPVLIQKGGAIRTGINEELDSLRDLLLNGKQHLKNLLDREIKKTGINSLKISFNNVFGYFLEVRNIYKDQVPADWTRKQTLVSAERYITEELKEYEERILNAEEKIGTIENKLYADLVQSLEWNVQAFLENARYIGKLDALSSFASLSLERKYCRPSWIDDGKSLNLVEARHPVIETTLPTGKPYISNGIVLDSDKEQIAVITGPNMAGKSALLRQVGLNCLLAQCGCFVAAEKAELPLLDRLFVRVGASDNISKGESTFMVEMNESASILNNLQGNCLVLLDEIGRGTSTYDGVSIAWSITSFLHEHPTRPLTLFATHYHELNEMTESHERIVNYNVSVKEVGKEIVFLRKLQRGGSAHSFGIHVARMAGMPQFVVKKAEQMLKFFEDKRPDSGKSKPKEAFQLSLIQMDDPLLQEVKSMIVGLDVNSLTPVEALIFLNDLQKKLQT